MRHGLVLSLLTSHFSRCFFSSKLIWSWLFIKKHADSWVPAFTFICFFSAWNVSPFCLLGKFQVISLKIPVRSLFLKEVVLNLTHTSKNLSLNFYGLPCIFFYCSTCCVMCWLSVELLIQFPFGLMMFTYIEKSRKKQACETLYRFPKIVLLGCYSFNYKVFFL